MEYKKFGTTEFEVPPMGLGCMRMSGPNGGVDDDESIATMHMAFDLGINFLDTSASYGNGHNHDLWTQSFQSNCLPFHPMHFCTVTLILLKKY